MKRYLVIWGIFLLVSCQHQASKEKALEYWDNNQFQLALNEICNAIELYPDSSSLYFLRMRIYEIMSRYDEELKEAGVETNEVSPMLLPHYARHERKITGEVVSA